MEKVGTTGSVEHSKNQVLAVLSDQEFILNFRNLAGRERRATIEVLHHINELERRRCHLALGFSSAFDFLTRDLGYSGSAAWRRIQSARLMRNMPEIESKIDSGVIDLTALAEAQRIFKADEKRTGKKIPVGKRLAAIMDIERKSTRVAQHSLHSLFPETAAELAARSETLRVSDVNHVRVHVTFTQAQMEKLKHLREVLSHRNFGASFAELVEIAVDHFLDRHDPLKPAHQSRARTKVGKQTHSDTGAGVAAQQIRDPDSSGSRAVPEATSVLSVAPSESGGDASDLKTHPVRALAKSIPASTRRFVFRRDHGRCQFKRGDDFCNSRFQLEIDHILPRALGGSNAPENLRLLCRAHNQHAAEDSFGKATMRAFRKH